MIKRYRTNSGAESESESSWISFTDLMAGFLIIILVTLAAALIKLAEERERLREETQKFLVKLEEARSEAEDARRARQIAVSISDELLQLFKELRDSQKDIEVTIQKMDDYDKTRFEILKNIKDELSQRQIEVTLSTTGDVMHISEDNLTFDLGAYKISDRFKNTMRIIGDEVAESLSDQKASIIDTVFVEGHTDNVPNSREMGNWGLSAYRAIALWNFWEKSSSPAGNLSKLKNSRREALFSVSGYGETRPREKIPKDSNQDQEINRRIDLRFNLQTAKKDLLGELSEKISGAVEKTDQIYEDLEDKMKMLKKKEDVR